MKETNNQFTYGKVIGFGHFGVVKEGTNNSTSEKVAK